MCTVMFPTMIWGILSLPITGICTGGYYTQHNFVCTFFHAHQVESALRLFISHFEDQSYLAICPSFTLIENHMEDPMHIQLVDDPINNGSIYATELIN